MSSDQIQREQGNTFFSHLFSLFSPAFLATLLQYYIILKENADRVWNQTCYTAKAVKYSFQDQYIRFYKVGNIFIPIHVFMGDRPPMMPGTLSWVYNCSTKTFTELDSVIRKVRKLPYIAVTLTNDTASETYADLSEWIVDVHTHSTDAFVPPQVLIGAFAFDTQTMLMHDLNSMFLRCMMLSLDEVTCNVGTGLDVDTPHEETPSESETDI